MLLETLSIDNLKVILGKFFVDYPKLVMFIVLLFRRHPIFLNLLHFCSKHLSFACC